MNEENKQQEQKGNGVLPCVKRSYYKNCAWCGKITTKDRWIEKNEANDKKNARPLCYKCGLDADYPEY